MRHWVFAVIFIFVTLSSAFADSTDASKWSNEVAVRDAERVVSIGKPLLYSSGGFVCRPRYLAKYRSLAQGLPIQTLGCGCELTGLSIVQSAYAETFNDRVLFLLSNLNTPNLTEVDRVH